MAPAAPPVPLQPGQVNYCLSVFQSNIAWSWEPLPVPCSSPYETLASGSSRVAFCKGRRRQRSPQPPASPPWAVPCRQVQEKGRWASSIKMQPGSVLVHLPDVSWKGSVGSAWGLMWFWGYLEETAIALGQDLALWGSSYSIPVSNAGRGW